MRKTSVALVIGASAFMLSGCLVAAVGGAAVGTAVGVTGAVVGTTAKVAGAGVHAVTGGDKKKKDQKKKKKHDQDRD
jgi:hypothetical protein